MNQVQKYIFFRVLRAVLVIVGGLALLAILAQGLSRTDIIVDNRQTAWTYFYIVALGAPQIMALLMPMAMFVAGIWALNRLHRDSEIVVAQAAGMTQWQIASPVVRLAVIGAIVHLGVNMWVQPTAQRELRETISDVRGDLASSLIRPGQFTSPDENLTVFAREKQGNYLIGIQIAERPNQPDARDYLAHRGQFIEIEGEPAIMMEQGEIHQLDANGALNILNFEQSTFNLSPFVKERGRIFLKASDRYLHELIRIDRTNYNERQNASKFRSELHARLTTPLISVAMALLAILAVLGGNFNRRGYSKRIMLTSVAALLLIMVQLVVQSASEDDPAYNIGQWLVPLSVIALLSYLIFRRGRSIGGPKTT